MAEIISPSNPAAEMERKLREYFQAGAQLVWYIDPIGRTAAIYTSPGEFSTIGETGFLEGGTLLPGFKQNPGELFRLAGEREEQQGA